MRRTFIVGCPRSGTTLIQAMLARHPDVATLPETALFEHLFGELHWRWGDRGVARRRRRGLARGFAREFGRRVLQDWEQRLEGTSRPAPWRLATCIDRFVALLDTHAARAGRTMWIEKTPNHLLYIPEIARHVPEARFVHVIRNGLDVVASIADANLHHDDNHGFGGDAKLWADRWNRATALHRRHVGEPNHHFVFLDDFVRDVPSGWRRLCLALDLDPDASLAETCSQPIADLADEPWKRNAIGGKPRLPRSKARALFGPALLDWLTQRLVSLEPLQRQCRAADHRHGLSRLRARASDRAAPATTGPA
ncbi:MAG: sulfotransferase [Xanthomonadaceae bacterium]|nr:sulfotransferase [Xanthomonadaceae bacterium]